MLHAITQYTKMLTIIDFTHLYIKETYALHLSSQSSQDLEYVIVISRRTRTSFFITVLKV
jgi:hypothetical protein